MRAPPFGSHTADEGVGVHRRRWEEEGGGGVDVAAAQQ